jgi:hypothetical protein
VGNGEESGTAGEGSGTAVAVLKDKRLHRRERRERRGEEIFTTESQRKVFPHGASPPKNLCYPTQATRLEWGTRLRNGACVES